MRLDYISRSAEDIKKNFPDSDPFEMAKAMGNLLLFQAMGGANAIPVGTAYAVWGAIGAVSTVLTGIVFFDEPVTFWRMVFLSTLVASVVGLQVVSD